MVEVLEGLPRGSYFLGKQNPAFANSHHCELLEAALGLQWHSVYQVYLSKWSIVCTLQSSLPSGPLLGLIIVYII